MPLSTVSGILTRIGMGRLGRLGLEPAERYERERPGELIHIDVKKLGRIQGGAGKRVTGGAPPLHRHATPTPPGVARKTVGWDYVHVAIDDAPAWPTPKSSPTRRPPPRSRFLRRAVAFYRPPRHHRRARASPTTARAYRSTVHAIACRALGIRHLRTRPYRPQTNGKAERFIRTMLGGWAYGAIYRTQHRTHRRP